MLDLGPQRDANVESISLGRRESSSSAFRDRAPALLPQTSPSQGASEWALSFPRLFRTLVVCVPVPGERRNSNEARDRTPLQRLIGQIDLGFVDVAPSPALWRIITLDNGVAGRLEVLRRVTVGRVVTAADMAACPTQAQMHPGRAAFQAFLATEGARLDIPDTRDMAASNTHQVVLIDCGTLDCGLCSAR